MTTGRLDHHAGSARTGLNPRLDWLVAAGIVALALGLRAVGLGERILFRDEAASWYVAHLPLPDLIARVAGEPYPPLYAAILGGWIRVFGEGEGALRALSVAAGLAIVAVGWRWAHEALGRMGGLVAGLLLALSPLAIANARDARMYALEAALSTTAAWLIWRLVAGRAGGRMALAAHVPAVAAATAGMAWTLSLGLPTAGLYGAITGLVLVVRAAEGGRVGGRFDPGALAALSGIGLGLVSFMPWLPNVLAAAANGRPFWTGVPAPDALLRTPGAMLALWTDDRIYGDQVRAALLWAGAIAGLAVAIVGALALLRSERPERRSLAWVCLAGVALVPMLWAISQVRSVYDTRYLGAAIAPLVLLVAAGVLRLADALRARRVPAPVGLVAALVAVPALAGSSLGVAGWIAGGDVSRSRDVIDQVAVLARPGDVIMAVDARSFFPLDYYASRRADAGTPLPDPVLTWDSGRQPFYNGQTLIDSAVTVRAADARAFGMRAALPGLAPGGHLWLLAVANGTNEKLNVAPLDDGDLPRLRRIFVGAPSETGQIVEVAVP